MREKDTFLYIKKNYIYMKGWVVAFVLFSIGYVYSQTTENIGFIRLPINWFHFGILLLFFIIYSEIYSRLERKLKWYHFILFFSINLVLWFFLTQQITELIGIGETISDYRFLEKIIDGLSQYYWLIIGFGIGTAVVDQIIHWILYGLHGHSEFTIEFSMCGVFIDEVFMRVILLGILLSLGLEIPVAIFLQALTYVIYYMDPTSKNRMRKANLNLMHGVIAGTIAIAFGWSLAAAIYIIRNIVWLIENKIGL